MACLSGFRPPQFSEDSAWLPTWLHHCNFDQLNVEGIKQDHITFEQRVEELQFLQKGVEDGESLRREGGCNIGQLFISGTDSSPFSYAQSANNGVVQFHLHLSSSGDDSENTDLTTDGPQTNSNYPSITQPLEDSGISVQRDVNKRAANRSPSLGLERPISKFELSKHDENGNLSEAADDIVELCIAASEAMVLNEVIENDDSFAKSSSASSILEASLQVKRARLEVWSNTFSCPTNLTSEIDSLSDLDDMTMESAYEDAGIHIHESYGNELSVSQVKDTFNDSCARITEGVIDDDDVQVGNDLTGECFNGGTRKTVIGNPVRGLGTDVDVGYEDYCLRVVDTHGELHISVPAEGANAPTAENNSHEINVRSTPTMICQDYSVPNIVQEQFKSRWFGGWTSNTPENEVKYTTVKHTVPEPFACETSFLSESAPDQNSFVQNHDKEAITASQLSTRTENLYNRAMDDETLISQDVRSSNASLVDPLCSVVPCSISENICSSPAVNYEDNINPGHFNITTECEKENNAQGEKIGTPIANIKELRNGVSRRFTSLADYSKQFPISTKFPEIDCGQKDSFLLESNIESTFWENRDETLKVGDEVSNKENTNTLSHLMDERRKSHFWASNSSTDNEENPIGTALPESKTPSVQKLGASKRVRFCEEETKISDKKKLRKAQIESKTCSSTRASKKSTRLSAYLESRARQMDREKKRLIFQNVEFLLTGFSQKKEKEIEGLIRKYGGIVLYQLPLINLTEKRSSRFKSRAVPIVLCLKKIQSFKFLYGCAVNGYVLKVNWLNDSIAAGFVLPPKKYMILPRNISRSQDQVYTAVNYNTHSLVFNNSGVMLHGKTKYFTNIATIIKHGGGQVFKTLQRLVQALEAGKISMGIVVVHDESCASRHLKHCALEKNISTTSVQWIIKSLYAGQLIPLEEEKSNSRSRPTIKLQRHQDSMDLSQEI